ncbi:hypothetical protein DXG03_007381 [Asterophora parasitica]|uniref:Cytochrome b5 heme-binding domain-containing protein n=1 Tax=Asterophora parasitica TaxID=117018 RepID=A0A9P7G814_9AGAR|nr:hypothetical protein DXG03_007381 [Asterophora parasitica]
MQHTLVGAPAPEPYRDPVEERTVKDPHIPNRLVTDKPANRPFIAYKQYREQQEALHAAWEERQKEREAKIARGEKVGPPEPDPTAHIEVGVLGLLKFIVYLLIFAALAGKFFTGSYTWEYEGKWTQLKELWPIDGAVYDVTQGKSYQPGGSYSILAGVDAARAFGTGCFKTHRTHDLRGLTEKELQGVEHWKKFYAEHKDYVKIGRVSHPPIDPASPIPEHCDPKKEEAVQAARKAVKGKKSAQTNDAEVDHQEL